MKVLKILTRFYVHDMDRAIRFYEQICNEPSKMRFAFSAVNLELASVGNILLICGPDEALKPFRDTQATFLVDSLHEFREFLLRNGATLVHDIKEVPTGLNMTVKHEDGTTIEYVEHRTRIEGSGTD